MRPVLVVVLALSVAAVAGSLAAVGSSSAADEEKPFTESFPVDAKDWSSTGSNACFRLEPGYRLEFEGKEDGKPHTLVITVLDETKKIDGVETRVVEERETEDGALVEISRNYFAASKRTDSVFYFGEDVDMYEDGKVTGHGGSWQSGVGGARYGLMMPGTLLLGSRYYQEVAPKVAMDRAEIVSMSESIETPAGKFENCLKAEETTPLEKGKEYKVYSPGIGLVRDGDLRLVRHGSREK